MTPAAPRVLHLMHSLAVGGKERLVLALAAAGRRAGRSESVLLFDRSGPVAGDLDPGDVEVAWLPRRPGGDLRYGLRLAGHLAAHPVDVVHAHNDSALCYAAAAQARLGRRRPRLIATYHNRPSRPGLAARLAARWAAGRAESIVCVSEELAATLRRRGWLARPAVVVPNGVDVVRFAPHGPGADTRRRLGVPRGTLLAGCIGRLSPEKRPGDLVDAADRLVRSGLPLAVVLVGDGPLRPALEERARTRPWLHVAGPAADVASVLRDLDVVVLCSEHEGMPMALLEAMACGRAVVATRVGGVPALLGDGDEPDPPGGRPRRAPAALLVPPGDAGALADAMLALTDGAMRRELGERARHRAVACYPLQRTAAAYGALYAEPVTR